MKRPSVDDGSKESKEAVALHVALTAKNKFGRDARQIVDLLTGSQYGSEKSESPDFLLKYGSDIVGVEHFEVTADTLEQRSNKFQSQISRVARIHYELGRGKKQFSDLECGMQEFIAQASNSNYLTAIRAFEYVFEKHKKKIPKYHENVESVGGSRLVFLVEMIGWTFPNLVAVGESSFNWEIDRIPLTKDIVDIAASADELDAVILLFNNYPFHDSTVFAFCPRDARSGTIGAEVYEYAGYDDEINNALARIAKEGIDAQEFWNSIGGQALRTKIDDSNFNAMDLLKKKVPCIIESGLYNSLIERSADFYGYDEQ